MAENGSDHGPTSHSDDSKPRPHAPPASDSDAFEKPGLVGIGASAGGLAALKILLSEFPEQTGLSFVIVVHLLPDHKSHLAQLLEPHCKMPVRQVKQTTKLEPDNVYVIPPNANIESVDTHLRLAEQPSQAHHRAPIDHFFRTMSKTHDGNSIGVVLTGTGTDGTQGLRRIKEKGGLTIVQSPDEAEFDGMPRSAISSGFVDLVLPLREIPAQILRLSQTIPRIVLSGDGTEGDEHDDLVLQRIFEEVRSQSGHDFTKYKTATMMRRIRRRMQLHRIESLPDYLALLSDRRTEVKLLFDDLLITVTEFFRDEEVFRRIENDVMPSIFEGKGEQDHVRIWSVGCATGEEAYSLAMLAAEQRGKNRYGPMVQIFATDLHDESIRKAREGIFPDSISAGVSPERLQRFFLNEHGSFRISNELREMVVFAPHNLLRDPPFSRVDLVVCRNMLIYLRRDVQADVVCLFHYALRPKGWLVLGGSETIESSALFSCEDKSCSIYRRRDSSNPELRLPVFPFQARSTVHKRESSTPPLQSGPLGLLHAKMVEQYAPPSIMVNDAQEVVHYSAHAGRYLQIPGGTPTNNVFKLIAEPLRIELRSALQLAAQNKRMMRSKPVKLTTDGITRTVVLRAQEATDPELKGYYLVIFDEVEPPRDESTTDDQAPSDASSESLGAELDLTKKRLHAIIEEYEIAQEETQASNEELQSANEELRATLEELETSKEELQSMNEELSTANQENTHRVQELSQLTNDLQNLLSATDIATLFLDRQMRISWFTPKVGELFNIRGTDRGRPLTDLTHQLIDGELHSDAVQVLRNLSSIEREVQSESGHWYLMRLLPYRTPEDRIEGVVITLVNITQRRNAELALRASEEEFRALINASASMVWSTDARGRIFEESPTWQAFTGQSFEQSQGQGWLDAVHEDDRPEVEQRWSAALQSESVFNHEFRVYHAASGTHRWTACRCVPLRSENQSVRGWVGMNSDITDRRRAQSALVDSRDALEQRVMERTMELEGQKKLLRDLANRVASAEHRERKRLAAILHDDLQQTLVALRMLLTSVDPETVDESMKALLDRGVRFIEEAIESSRDLTRQLRPPVLYEAGLIPAMRWLATEFDRVHRLKVTVQATQSLPAINEDVSAALFESVRELLLNVVKHGQTDQATVEVTSDDAHTHITVADSGTGFKVKEPTSDDGCLGLFSIRERLEGLGGGLEIESQPGRGTRVTMHLPNTLASADHSKAIESVRSGRTARDRRTPSSSTDEVIPVIVVDDHAVVRRAIVRLLTDQTDIEVVGEAADGRAAIELIDAQRPRVVIMDVNLPRFNGVETTKHIRSHWPEIRIVGISVQNDESTRNSMLEAGAAAFVSKSDVHNLISAVRGTADATAND